MKKLQRIYGRNGIDLQSVFVEEILTAISHHEVCPQFYEEAKILLPAHLHEKHHILFTFYHVSIEAAVNPKSKTSVENIVGFSWLPLVKNGRICIEQNSNLSVASSLPNDYLASDGVKGPIWLEGGRPLFKVSVRLCSSALTKVIGNFLLKKSFRSESEFFFLYADSGFTNGI